LLDIEKAANIIAEFSDEPIEEISQIIGQGLVNKVFKIRTNSKEVILRFRDETEAFEEYRKEAWCIKQASNLGIPVPEVIKVGKFGETPYMIQSYINGSNGQNDMVDSKIIWKKLGEYIRSIHSIEIRGFGLTMIDYENGVFGDSFNPTWIEHIDYNISSITEDDKLISLKVYEKNQLSEIRNIFNELKSKKFKFGLNHSDIALRNTIINNESEIYLIDWGCALAHVVPYYDLLTLFKSKFYSGSPSNDELQAFLEGYGISKSEFEELKPNLYSIMLLDAFDKLRWAIDRSPSDIEGFSKYAKSVLGDSLIRY
jgi:tRNA A-37 threonylcarbamoyl transferase component Bud32